MNRTIKFRCLVTYKIGKLFYKEFIFFNLNSLRKKTINEIIRRKLKNKDCCSSIRIEKFEQYAGLKDKKRKDIYEGDLIEHRDCIMECEFSESCFVFKNDKVGVEQTCDNLGDVEIIGNIHENPELLGEKKK